MMLEEKKIILARLVTMPSNIRLSLGKFGTFDRKMLISEVEKESEVGEIVVTAHMNYLRSFKQMLHG